MELWGQFFSLTSAFEEEPNLQTTALEEIPIYDRDVPWEEHCTIVTDTREHDSWSDRLGSCLWGSGVDARSNKVITDKMLKVQEVPNMNRKSLPNGH